MQCQLLLGLMLVFALQQVAYSYKAAVVEFSIDQCGVDRVKNNLNGLKETVERAQKENQQTVDIVVLPEYAITGYTFHSRESIAPLLEVIPDSSVQPCGNQNYDNSIFQRLSCIARDNKIVLVANMGEKKKMCWRR